MKRIFTALAAAAALGLAPGSSLAQHVDVGPGGVNVHDRGHEHIEERHEHVEKHVDHGDEHRDHGDTHVRVEKHEH